MSEEILDLFAELTPPPGMDLSWQDYARCAEIPGDEFFPEVGQTPRLAIQICNGCEVKAQCLDYALAIGTREGVFGGTTPKERRAILRERKESA